MIRIDIRQSPLTELIADRFSVPPIQSTQSYELFESPEGGTLRLQHYTFALYMPNKDTDFYDRVDCLTEALWENVKQAWPEGTFLLWRSLPTVDVIEDKTLMQLRIGSFIEPDSKLYKKEGHDVPVLGSHPV